MKRALRRTTESSWRRGMVLVLVLIVVSMLTLAGYSFSELMFIEYKGARLAGRRAQARGVVESAAEAVMSYLDQPRELQAAVGGHDDNPEYWQGVLAFDDPSGPGEGRFCVIAPPELDAESAPPRFGLADESGRLNLSALLAWDARQPGIAREALLHLPGMTAETADALLDWMDADDESRESGAESEHYERLEPPIHPSNAVPTALEELLLVRGVTRGLLFGEDANRNGTVESQERVVGTAPMASPGGAAPRGWCAYLTLHGAEANRDELGQPRINLNSDPLPPLHQALVASFDKQLADFVIHYRQFGPVPAGVAGPTLPSQPADLSLPGPFKFDSPWDLIGATVSLPLKNSPVLITSPLSAERERMRLYLPKLLDRLTTSAAPAVIGRINVNEAPRAVLLAIPGIDPATVDAIVAKRATTGRDPLARHAAWLALDDIVDLARMRTLWPYVTGGGDVYRAQLVAYWDRPAPAERVEIVVAATSRPSRLVSWKDLRSLGTGYASDVLATEPASSRR